MRIYGDYGPQLRICHKQIWEDKETYDKTIKKTKTRANKAKMLREVNVGEQSMFKHGVHPPVYRFIYCDFLVEIRNKGSK